MRACAKEGRCVLTSDESQEPEESIIDARDLSADELRQLLGGGMEDVPEFYVDSFGLRANPYTVTLTFGLSAAGETQPRARILMSPTHAKMMAILFRRALKSIEDESEEIPIRTALLEDKSIDLDTDW